MTSSPQRPVVAAMLHINVSSGLWNLQVAAVTETHALMFLIIWTTMETLCPPAEDVDGIIVFLLNFLSVSVSSGLQSLSLRPCDALTLTYYSQII